MSALTAEDKRWCKRTARELLNKRRALAREMELKAHANTPAKKDLDAKLLEQARGWIAKGHTLEEFFAINADILGDPGQYGNLDTILPRTDREWLDGLEVGDAG